MARITTILEHGKSLDWGHATNQIAFDLLGADGYYDVALMEPDGANLQCLTCNRSGVPQRHNGSPTWHPSGQYIAFVSQNADADCIWCDWLAIPGTGVNSNLWLMTSDGTQFWQLTDIETRLGDAQAVIHPQFSQDGKRLVWSVRLGGGDQGPWGEWAIRVGTLVMDSGEPHLSNVETYQPGARLGLYEATSFRTDAGGILFCSDTGPDQEPFGLDIYALEPSSGALTQLTDTPSDWDEHAHYRPNGQQIAWMSSAGMAIEFPSMMRWGRWQRHLATDLWIMGADGSDKRRLTFFNEPGHPHYTGTRTVVSDLAWGPSGNELVALIAYEQENARLKSRIVTIELE